MSAPTKLFLEKNDIDGLFHVVDKNGHAFGGGCDMPDDAIRHARTVSDAPIFFGSGVSVSDDKDVYTTYELIQELANLGGFKVRQAYDSDMKIIGWTMELKE